LDKAKGEENELAPSTGQWTVTYSKISSLS